MKVYIAGPYSHGDVAVNIREAILAGDRCLRAGHQPFIPHLINLWSLICPKPYEKWLEITLAWVPVCKALIRIPGLSPGADKEVVFAMSLQIPVYYSVDEFLSHTGRRLGWPQ